jgi:K+-transporting ATPase KdpF subunit
MAGRLHHEARHQRKRPAGLTNGDLMTLLSLLLSVAAFVYLVYAMLRPEKF